MSKQINIKPQTGALFWQVEGINKRMSSLFYAQVPSFPSNTSTATIPAIPISEAIAVEAHGGERYYTAEG